MNCIDNLFIINLYLLLLLFCCFVLKGERVWKERKKRKEKKRKEIDKVITFTFLSKKEELLVVNNRGGGGGESVIGEEGFDILRFSVFCFCFCFSNKINPMKNIFISFFFFLSLFVWIELKVLLTLNHPQLASWGWSVLISSKKNNWMGKIG